VQKAASFWWGLSSKWTENRGSQSDASTQIVFQSNDHIDDEPERADLIFLP